MSGLTRRMSNFFEL